MKLIDNTNPSKRIDYTHYIEHNGVKYIREEVVIPQSFHTIKWRPFDEQEYQTGKGLIHYYSKDHGWDKDGVLDPNNPIPELELLFKESLGKNLIYF